MKNEFQVIAELIENDKKVLDVGCGDGILMDFLKKNKNTNVNYIGEYYCKVSVHKTGNITNMLINNMSKLWKKRINYSMFKIKDRNNISYEQILNN